MSTSKRGPTTHRTASEEAREAPLPKELPASLVARVAELEQQLEEAQDRHIRLAADFDNYRKRSRQEQLEIIQHAGQRLIEALLPVLDDLHLTLAHAPDQADDSWVKGFELSIQKLEDVLAAQGLQPIDAIGQPFDPKLHEAVGSEESEAPEDTVLQELRRGYRLHDRVLRPALVRVARRRVHP